MDLTNTDIYKFKKEEVINILKEFKVEGKENNTLDEIRKINLLPTYLAQSALNWYESFIQKNQEGELTWEKAKKELINLFAPIAQSQNLQIMLENKIQTESEPSISFYLQIQALCRRMNPNIEDTQIISHVIQGLKPEICERIITMENKTLSQLEDNLRKI